MAERLICENRIAMNVRLAVAMAIYAALALLAAVTLSGKVRIALWIFLGGLAAKTAIAAASKRNP